MDPEKILRTDYLDLIFKGRNKEYGSYQLRKRYMNRMVVATAITLGIIVLMSAINIVSVDHESISVEKTGPPIVLKDIPVPKTPPPPPPPRIEKKEKGSTAPATKISRSYTTLKVVPNDKVSAKEKPDPPKPKEDIAAAAHSNDGSNKPDAKDAGLKPSGTGKPNALGDDTKADDGSRKDIISVQQLASFPGGMSALYKFIQDNLRYPSGAMEQNIQGQVVVEFVVAANGQVSSITVVRDLGYGTAAEAMRILVKMPKWTPAKQNGKPIASYFTLPITFKLH